MTINYLKNNEWKCMYVTEDKVLKRELIELLKDKDVERIGIDKKKY